MLSTSGLQAAPFVPRGAPRAIGKLPKDHFAGGTGNGKSKGEPTKTGRRTQIWEFSTNLHCSIVGTCLSTAELRQLLIKLEVDDAVRASDHDLHCVAVVLASRQDRGSKFLQKALDRRHRTAIARYGKLKLDSELLQLWEESLGQGDIPGSYWAVLTHPSTTNDIVRRVFADVHMLSHLVGAANRADIRKLRQLEAENAALASKLERLQRHLHEGFVERDRDIRRLNDLLTLRAEERSNQASSSAGDLDLVIHDLSGRLAREKMRRERSEKRANELTLRLRETEQTLDAKTRECASACRELVLLERHSSMATQPDVRAHGTSIDLSGFTLLYVGGRPNHIPQIKDLVESHGANFLHHDGGVEHSSGLIPGLISRADRVFFPTDCVSHDAVATIKRVCRTMAKTYEPLRNASLTCLFSALLRISGQAEGIAAE
jgi:hypothetical protein